MKQKIRQLADEALIYANATWDPESDANLFVAIAMERHAQLIVRECISAGIETGILDQDWNYPAYIEALKKRGLYAE